MWLEPFLQQLCFIAALSAAVPLPPETFKLGSFSVKYDGIGVEVDWKGAPVWATAPGGHWAGYATGQWAIVETEGMIKFDIDVPVCSGDATIIEDAAKMGDDKVVFVGKITSGSRDFGAECLKEMDFNLTIALTDTSAKQLEITLNAPGRATVPMSTVPLANGIKQPFRRTTLFTKSRPTDRVRGFGVQYTYGDMKGKVVPILSSEQGIGRGVEPITNVLNSLPGHAGGNWHTTYSATPHYIAQPGDVAGSRGVSQESDTNADEIKILPQSFWLTGSDYSEFNLTEKNMIGATVYAPMVAARVAVAGDPLGHIEEFTTYSGRMTAIPTWAMSGAIIGYEGGTQAVVEMDQLLRKAGIEPTAWWLQDWSGLRVDPAFGKRVWWNWELDSDHYPDWDGLCLNMSKAGTRLLTYVNPFLANTVSKSKPNFRRDLFAEAEKEGYLVKNVKGAPYILASGSPLFTFGTVDLSNPDAFEWFRRVIQDNMIGACSSGWMSDFGEYLPFDAVIANGDASTYHNLYPQRWAEVNRAAVQPSAEEPPKALFWSRSSHTRSPGASTLFWLGDQLVTWDAFDGLKSMINGHLSSGLSGYALQHSDIGGYTMVNEAGLNYVRSKELLLRWAEASALSDVVFRTHVGNLPNESAQIWTDADSLACFLRASKLHDLFVPYRTELMSDVTTKGYPVTRAMWLAFPKDPIAAAIDGPDQFMIGSEFLVAPVTDPGTTSVTVYLPRGEWVDAWTRQIISGGKKAFSVPAPLGKPAIFYPLLSRVGASFAKALTGLAKYPCPVSKLT